MPSAIGGQYGFTLATDNTITDVNGFWRLASGIDTYTFTFSAGGTKRGSEGDASLRAGGSWQCLAYNNSGFFRVAGNFSTAWPSQGRGSETVTITFPGSNPPGSRNYFKIYASLTDSHDSGTSVISGKIQYPPDNLPPIVTIIPVSIIVTNSSGSKFTASDPAIISVSAVDDSTYNSGLKSINIDGTDYNTSPQNIQYSGEVLHTVTARAKDNNDNVSADSTYDFSIDTTPPSVSIGVDATTGTLYTSGTNPYYNTDTIVVKIDTSDSGSGLDDGILNINGTDTAFSTIPTQTSYLATLTPTEGIVEGQNVVKYTSKDVVGNEASDEVSFYVDTTEPTCFIVISTQDSIRENNSILYTKESNVNVNLHFGDGGTDPSGTSKGLVKINNSTTPTVADFSSGIDLSSETSPKNDYNITGLVAGQLNELTFFVKDKTDNISSGDTVSVFVDQTLPTGSILISTQQLKSTVSSLDHANTVDLKVKLEHADTDSGLF